MIDNRRQVAGRPGLVKNEKTGVFNYINSNETIEKLRKAKKKKIDQENDINNLKKEVSEIKDMLQKIMQKL